MDSGEPGVPVLLEFSMCRGQEENAVDHLDNEMISVTQQIYFETC